MTPPPVPAAFPRRRGLSIRVKLTLSYAGFLVVAGTVLSVVLLLVLRYVPDENLVTATGNPGSFAPGRSDLIRAALPLVGAGLGLLAVIGLVGGWFLAGRLVRPLRVLTDAVGVAGRGSLSPGSGSRAAGTKCGNWPITSTPCSSAWSGLSRSSGGSPPTPRTSSAPRRPQRER